MVEQGRGSETSESNSYGRKLMVTWGDFDSMATHYIRLLASTKERDPIWIEDGSGGTYGVCSYQEYAQLVSEHGEGRYRPVSTMTRVEFMGLILVRYKDFFTEDEDDPEKKDLSAGKQLRSESTAMDDGPSGVKVGGLGDDVGGSKEENNHRTVQ